jgi:dipeptidase D
MKITIKDLQPATVWKHFQALTQIPRPSGFEAEVIRYISEFARGLNLSTEIDSAGNLLIRKEATNGHEQAEAVVLQVHVDMVPQKNSDKIHDFRKDAIETVLEGEWLKANGTTLGADNGIGVAAAMAILEADDIGHGPIEVLCTVNEETGMEGAFGLSAATLNAKILLNLDSEDEGELFVGCAGGIDANVVWNYKEESYPGKTFTIALSGLKGGHSGIDIHLGRANANKVLARLLLILNRDCQARVAGYTGGDMRNAIPREASVEVVVPTQNIDRFNTLIGEFRKEIKVQFEHSDAGIQLDCKETGSTVKPIAGDDQQRILNALNSCMDGVINMSAQVAGVVQTSSNLAIVTLKEGRGEAKLLLRSSSDQEKQELAEQVSGLFKLSGASVELTGEYPGWQPDANSPVLKKAREVYAGLFGKEPEVKVIHAGLECGIIGGKYPAMDMLSFGPTIRFPHSPDEKVHIESVNKFWIFLTKLLANIS